MLQQIRKSVIDNDPDSLREVARNGKALDRLQEALKAYITHLGTDGLSDTDALRHVHVLEFIVNLRHSGDIIERGLADAASRKARRGLALPKDDEADFNAFHARVMDNLKLSASTFMTGDRRSAQHLLDAKRQLNAMERAAGRRHLLRLEARERGGLEVSTLHLAMLRDLRRVNSHLCSIAYDVLGLDDLADTSDDSVADRAGQIHIDEEKPMHG
jgi:phosphate:Na+ symporter